MASGCDEFNQGAQATASVDMDVNVKAFVQASADLQAVAARIKNGRQGRVHRHLHTARSRGHLVFAHEDDDSSNLQQSRHGRSATRPQSKSTAS